MISTELSTPTRAATDLRGRAVATRRMAMVRTLRLVALIAGVGLVVILAFRVVLPWWTYRSEHVLTRNALVTAQITEVGARIDGQVTELVAAPGTAVKQGDVLAQLADSHLRLRLEQRKTEEQLARQQRAVEALSIEQAGLMLETALASGRAQADVIQAELVKAQSDFTRSQSELTRTKSELARAKSGLAKAQSELARWESEAQRVVELRQSGSVSEREIERISTERASAAAECESAKSVCDSAEAACGAAAAECDSRSAVIQGARASIEAANLEVRRAELSLESLCVRRAELAVLDARIEMARATAAIAAAELEAAQVRAPQDGVVNAWIIGPGGSVRVGQPIVALQLAANLQVQAWVDQKEMGGIAVGDAARVSLDALPDLVLEGSVQSILAQPAFDELGEPAHPSRSSLLPPLSRASLLISVQDPERVMHPGMTARVSLARRSDGR